MSDFKVGDYVWAKYNTYPFWPAKVSTPPDTLKEKKSKQYYVYFFGSKNFGWVKEKNVLPHNENTIKLHSKKSTKSLQKAIEEILQESPLSHSPEGKSSNNNCIESSDDQSRERFSSAFDELMNVPERKSFDDDRAGTSDDDDDEHLRPLMTFKGTSTKLGTKRKSKSDKLSSNSPKPAKIRKSVTPKIHKKALDRDFRLGSVSPLESGDQKIALIRPYDVVLPALQSSILTRREHVDRPSSPPFSIHEIPETFGRKDLVPTQKKIGFLGLGHRGRVLAKHFLNTGHDLMVWNRSHEKCNDFVDAGAKKGLTPSDVVSSCDITFCCVSDADAVQNIVIGTYGVLIGLASPEIQMVDCESKGFVELSSIDAETSKRMEEAVTNMGGKYLSAPLAGDRSEASEGSLTVIASGDKELYDDCTSLFQAIAKSIFYLSPNVEDSVRMSHALSTFKGITNASLGEAMALVSRFKINGESFMQLVNKSFSCKWISSKISAMHNKAFDTEMALKHQQKDLVLTLAASETVHQPMYITSAANDLYVRAKRLRYYDHDMSSVYFGSKY